MDSWKNQLFFGDNLDVLRKDIPADSVDLIYLDAPVQLQRQLQRALQGAQDRKAVGGADHGV
jgi:hypothetical protein